MPTLDSDFVPAAGLWNAHAQSLFGVTRRPPARVRLERERRETPDGDFVDLDVVRGRPGQPTVVLLHGLEGSSSSGYMQVMLRGCALRGWTGIALHARGCSGELNRQAASYSSGDYRDLAWLVPTLEGTVLAVGFSLGASVLLNFLARDERAHRLRAAAAVSAPYDLQDGARFLDSGSFITRQYLERFLPAMKARALEKAKRHPADFDVPAITAARSIRDFDHLVTARHFGFSSAEHYYAHCSAGPLLRDVRVRTLLLSSRDDELARPSIPPGTEANAALDVLLTTHGGHVGFVGGSVFRPRFWAEERVFAWLERELAR
ncbi:MAG: alpha/beta fold hydrolase [Myxococcaceae bacterium]